MRSAEPLCTHENDSRILMQDITRIGMLKAISLRYFNPIGADPQLRSGAIVARPTHVLGKMLDAALGRIPYFEITGTEYETRDGSGMRDFVHVADLAMAHVRAIERFDAVLEGNNAPSTDSVLSDSGGDPKKDSANNDNDSAVHHGSKPTAAMSMIRLVSTMATVISLL